MNTKKRGLAWLLTLAMCMSMMTLSAFASYMNVNSEEGFRTALNTSGVDTINITGSFSVSAPLEIRKQLALDLGGYTISTAGENFVIENYSNLRIMGNGTLSSSTYPYGAVYNAGNLRIDNGTFRAANGIAVYNESGEVTLVNGTYTGWCAVYNKSGTMYINGGSYNGTGTAGNGAKSYAIRQMGGTMNITGGTVTGGHGAIGASTGALNISGGTFSTDGYCALYIAGEAGTVSGLVTGGTFTAEGKYPAIWVGNLGTFGGSRQNAVLTIRQGTTISAPYAYTVLDTSSTGNIVIDTATEGTQTSGAGTITILGNTSNIVSGTTNNLIVKSTNIYGYVEPSSDSDSDSDSTSGSGTVSDSGGLTINEDAVPLAENSTVETKLDTVSNNDGSVTTTREYSDGATQVTTEKTVTNADGSTTTTTTEKYTAADGTVTDGTSTTVTKTNATTGETTSTTNATSVSSDGTKTETKSETVSKTDGSSTTTSTEVATNAAGQKQTTDTEIVFDANGSYTQNQSITDYVGSTGSTVTVDGATTSATATISEAAVEQAKAIDGVITVPISIWALEETIAPKMDVNMPLVVTTDTPAKVQVPVVNMGPYAVAVIVDENGNEIIDKYSTMTDTTLVFNIEGTSIIKVVDNTKEFVDVKEDDWFNDSIQYVAAREIFNGTSTSAQTYSPNADTSRAMIAQALFNFDRNPAADPSSLLPDAEGKWYSDAAGWSLSAGVFKGSDGNFEGDRPITRQELAAVLYRYAGENGYKTDGAKALDSFPDASGVADYAKEAMEWAVGNGIINGSEGKLIAGETATRAQVSAMFMRFCQNIVK